MIKNKSVDKNAELQISTKRKQFVLFEENNIHN